jgi:Sjogren's syndrome/scleroderma autoantigen 1 (Autoantigen p27)
MTLAVQTGHEAGQYHGLRSPLNDEDLEIERLLSQKLLEGYVLMERSCPACATPLVKNHVGQDEDDAGRELSPFVVPSQSFDQPFRPVNGVPFCVSCQAHVVTDESEISILEQCDSLKTKGQILISLQSYASEVQEEQNDDVDDEIRHVRSGEEETRPAKNGCDATSLLCGTTASRQMVVQTPEPHSHDQGLELEHEKALFTYNSYAENEAAKKEAPKSPQFHSDEKKDDDDHHYHRTASADTPQTSEGEKTEQGIEEYSVR